MQECRVARGAKVFAVFEEDEREAERVWYNLPALWSDDGHDYAQSTRERACELGLKAIQNLHSSAQVSTIPAM
jgi:hypothetical protein